MTGLTDKESHAGLIGLARPNTQPKEQDMTETIYRYRPQVGSDKDIRAWALGVSASALANLPGQRSNTEGGSPSYVYSSSGWSVSDLLDVAEWLVSGIRPLDYSDEGEDEDESPEVSWRDTHYVKDAQGDKWESQGDGRYLLVSSATPEAVGLLTLASDDLHSEYGPLTPSYTGQLDREPEQA